MAQRESCFTSTILKHNDVVPRALIGARKDGKSIFAGKKVTGFSNTEEEAVGRVKVRVGLDRISIDIDWSYRKYRSCWKTRSKSWEVITREWKTGRYVFGIIFHG